MTCANKIGKLDIAKKCHQCQSILGKDETDLCRYCDMCATCYSPYTDKKNMKCEKCSCESKRQKIYQCVKCKQHVERITLGGVCQDCLKKQVAGLCRPQTATESYKCQVPLSARNSVSKYEALISATKIRIKCPKCKNSYLILDGVAYNCPSCKYRMKA